MNFTRLLDAELCTRLVLTMGHFIWQGAALATVGGLAAWALRHSSAAKYRVYIVTLLLMGACPVATYWVLSRAAENHANAGAIAITTTAATAAPTPPLHAPAQASTPQTSPPALHVGAMPPGSTPVVSRSDSSAVAAGEATVQSADWRRHAPKLALAYLAGVLLMLARVLLGLRGAKRLCRRAEPIDDPALLGLVARLAGRLGMLVAPRVMRCRDVLVPTVAGILRPVILVPGSILTGLSPEQIEAILAHELAHIRRHDHIVQLAQRVIEAVLFFHPAVWFVSRRLHAEREHCCDDEVVRAVGRPVTYAHSLVRVAELCLAKHEADARPGAGAQVSLAAVERGTLLRRRILRVLEGSGTPQLRLARVWVVALVMAGTVLTTTAWFRHATAAADEPKPQMELTGVVTDAQGRRVSNACITSEGENPYFGVRSDASGTFTLKGFKPGVRHGVAFSQRSRRMGLFTLPAQANAEPLPISLTYWEADVDGRVVDRSGNPVKGAHVRVFVKTPDGETFRFPAYGKTDASGYYSIGLIPAGPDLKLHATLSDDPDDGNRTEVVAVSHQYQVELPDLVVKTATAPSPKPGPQRVRYAGRVVDQDGQPVAGAEIDLSYPKSRMVAGGGCVLTDADGRFARLLPPDADRVEMRISHPEFLSYHFNDRVAPAVSALREGSAVIVLKRGLPLSGMVLDDQGRPLPNALVLTGRLYSSTGGPENEVIEDATSPRTDSEGAFLAQGLPPGPREVTVLADGFAPKLLSVEIKPDGPPIEIQLQRGASFSARLLDSEGKPIADAKVGCDDWTVNGQRGRLSRFTKSDPEGAFTLDALPTEGTLSFYASAKGYLSNSFEWSAGGGNPETFTLYKPPVITGVVRDAQNDRPISDFEVRPGWYWREGEAFTESSFDGVAKVKDEQGRFSKQIERIIVGRSEIPTFAAKIVAKGYLPQVTPKVHLGKPYEPFVIRLRKSPWVSAVVKSPAGEAVQGATVVLVEPHNVTYVEGLAIEEHYSHAPEIRAKTDAKGAFELPPPATAPARVLVLHETGYAIQPTEGLKGNGAEVKLIPWARVEGDLVIDGTPVNAESLALQISPEKPFDPNGPKEIEFALRTSTRADGRFTFERVPARPAVLVRQTPGGPSGGVAVTPEAGQAITVHLGDRRQIATGKLDLSGVVGDSIKDPTTQLRVRAFRLNPPPPMPPTWRDPAAWDAAVESARTTAPALMSPLSTILANVASAQADGSLRFDDLLPGHYVMYVNVHAPPVPDVCGLGRVLAEGRVEFQVLESSSNEVVPLPKIPLETRAYPAAGDPAPPIEGKTVSGEPFSLDKLRGKVVLIDFWASWCAPCMAAMPEMKKLHEKYANDPRVEFIGGNFDWKPGAAEAALDELKLPWKQVALGELSFENPICRAYGVSAIPSVWIISADGKVIAKDLRGEQIAEELEKALAK